MYPWKKSNTHSFHFNLLVWKKNISQLFFVENRTFILCKHFLHFRETCQLICLIIGYKRKNAYILGLKSAEIYVAALGEINLPLIILWDLRLISGKNIWRVNITYMYVVSTDRNQNWLLFWIITDQPFTCSKWTYDHRLNSTIVSLLILLTFWEGYICNGKNRDFNSKIIVQCRLKAFQESRQKPSKIFMNDLDFCKVASWRLSGCVCVL